VAPPLYYVVPPQWSEVIERLRDHGLELALTREPQELEVESYRFTDVKWASAPFEGRFLSTFNAERIRERRKFPTGSAVISLAQPGAKVAISLLEPEGPDSLVVWGFFSAIFEEKEYAEPYILESLAREMIQKDPDLLTEFQSRLRSDPEFASSPNERLLFFYKRSPYWDPCLAVYPVGRVTERLSLALLEE
jgi:hypothetical protein